MVVVLIHTFTKQAAFQVIASEDVYFLILVSRVTLICCNHLESYLDQVN